MRKAFFVVGILALLTGCSGGSGGTDTPAAVAGTWCATMISTGGTQVPVGGQFTVTLTLYQNGAGVWGNFQTQGGQHGDINGTASGQSVTFDATQLVPCGGAFHGAGIVTSSTAMHGTYTGSDCNGSIQADFAATSGAPCPANP